MKLPALWIATAFACGIALASRWPGGSVPLWFALASFTMLAAAALLWRRRAVAAWVAVLAAWVLLGGLAAAVERGAIPVNHVTRLIAAGSIDTTQPLRWRGRLREDPMTLPWGQRFEMDIEQVESAGRTMSASGGLRVNLYLDSKHSSPSDRSALAMHAGDRVEALVHAKPPRNFLDPGAFDLRGFLARQNIDLIGTLRDTALLRVIDRPSATITQRLARVRGVLLDRIDELFAGQPERAAVLRAMLLGDRSFVDSTVVTAFQKTGAYHVLVIAGLHVGALVVFLLWLCRRLRLPMGLSILVTLLGLAAYLGIVQDRPPILRAALMAALYLSARPLFRRVELLNTIALAALVILVWKPSALADSSFELSFLAAGVIAGLALPWIDRSSAPYRAGLRHLGDVTRDGAHSPRVIQFRIELRAASGWLATKLPTKLATHAEGLLAMPIRAGLRLWEVVLLSAVIQWGMLPLLAQDFHRVSLSGPLSNIPAVILTGLIVPIGFLTLGATFLSMRLASIAARMLGICVEWLLASVRWFAHLPRMSYRIPGPPPWVLVAFFAMFVCLAVAARRAAVQRRDRAARRNLPPPIHPAELAAAVLLAALTIVVASYPFAPRLARGKLEVTVLDVGQGDSIFVAFPDGRTMLVDGGGLAGSESSNGHHAGLDVGEQVVSPYLWSRGLKHLDVVALTHAHHDHLDGLFSVLQNFRVGQLWIGRDEDTHSFEDLLSEARSRGIPVFHETSGKTFDWDGARGQILWPMEEPPAAQASNDDSMVMRIEDGAVRFLLPGDIQKKAEEDLAAQGAPLAADFLKVPHHGSKTSSTPDFLAAVSPRVAVVSSGEGNPFGHPAPSTVERYQQAGIRLLRTDRDGAVTALTDGKNLMVSAHSKTLQH